MSNSELSRREFLGLASGASFLTGVTTKIDRSEPIADQPSPDRWFGDVPVGRSIVRAGHAMAAVLNVTEPPMTGLGGDVFAMVYSAKAQKLEGLNASGRAPRALNVEHF